MKVYGSILAAGVLQSLSWGASAFTVQTPQVAPATVMNSATESEIMADTDMYPVNPTYESIQGGGTVRTYQMPEWATKAQMAFKSRGRPLRATANLWIGPRRQTHNMSINNMDGNQTPYMSTITFKKLAPVIRVETSDSLEFPAEVSVWVPPPEKTDLIHEKIKNLWENATPDQKQLIQGADVEGGIGAVRTWNIPEHVKSVQLVAWSKDTSKKSLKAKIEVLQGPNNKRQDYDLQCGGSTQPFHCVFQTPGPNWIIRAYNKKFVEDGLFELAVIPVETTASAPPAAAASSAATVVSTPAQAASTLPPPQQPVSIQKQWWQ